jgi:mono/diheme cytochrome c family protein
MKKYLTAGAMIALLGTGWFLMADDDYEEREYRRDQRYEKVREYGEKRYDERRKAYRDDARYKRGYTRDGDEEDEKERDRYDRRASEKVWKDQGYPDREMKERAASDGKRYTKRYPREGDDEDEAGEGRRAMRSTRGPKMQKPEYAELYRQECAACHMAYQPEFLPKRSWKKMMSDKALQDHFGTDATLEESDRQKIAAFLEANSADSKATGKYFRKIARSIPDRATPLRISETPYFKKEHREIPRRLITQTEVKSIANCAACHRTADKGYYGERDIVIPNYGRWDD